MARLVSVLGCLAALLAGCADHSARSEVAPSSAAVNMQATTYHDGHSCPNGCDAHVVFQLQHNGTRNAFLPGIAGEPLLRHRSNPAAARCVNGSDCVICFDDADASCMVARYRGNGPQAGRFDFTLAFLRARCSGPSLPARFAAECAEKRRIAAELARRVNCIANPEATACRAIMQSAVAAKQRDLAEYGRCKQLGVPRYNAQQPDAQRHRHPSNGCEYFLNQRGASWFKLAPGACGDGYFVGPYGTDCCSADPFQAAVDRVECGHFYR